MVALEIFLNGYKVIFSSRQCPLQIQSWFSCHLQSTSIDCVSRKQKIRGFLLLNIYSFHTATSRPVKTCTPDISQISTCPSSPNLSLFHSALSSTSTITHPAPTPLLYKFSLFQIPKSLYEYFSWHWQLNCLSNLPPVCYISQQGQEPCFTHLCSFWLANETLFCLTEQPVELRKFFLVH